jgi:TIR domain
MIPAGNNRRRRVPDIFVSYTSSDQVWAFWIGQELEKLGHVPHVHEWEISGGGDIAKWMDERLTNADFVLCVVSAVYLTKDYSGWERRAAQWAAQNKRPNFALPVFIEDCQPPPLLALVKGCDLHGISEEEARARLATYLAPAGKPSEPVRFPGAVPARPATVAFPGRTLAPVLSPVTGPSDGIAHARGVFSAAQLGKTMANPRYADDFSRLDRVYDRRAIINMETVMIVVGNRIPPELLDRPVAESLRNVIDRKGGIEHPFRRAIVLTDSAWSAEAKDVALNAVIAIGSHRANELSKKLQGEPTAGATKFPVAGRAGCYGLFQKNAAGLPQVTLWGEDAKTTRRAVELYVEAETGLDQFLNIVWK